MVPPSRRSARTKGTNMITYDATHGRTGVRMTDEQVEALHVQVELATVAFWAAATSPLDEIAHCQSTTYRAMEGNLLATVAQWAIALGYDQPVAVALYYRDVLANTGLEPIGYTLGHAVAIRDGEARRP